jgi:hypothetical protein
MNLNIVFIYVSMSHSDLPGYIGHLNSLIIRSTNDRFIQNIVKYLQAFFRQINKNR